ncbi:hypothetical protein [Chondromyces apiculatus]|uniref:Lipoprotein n=1 Tax=Chondromyces apiculatus DSM 436 TaxID=1192034 RepID=A0A017SVY6_9BACT|nr:hypothetical protein [Chondromyces apiculatus]EYF01109.1 Hypothetical protein CAP_8614 [Chondromyces apiculatus DSM 436]
MKTSSLVGAAIAMAVAAGCTASTQTEEGGDGARVITVDEVTVHEGQEPTQSLGELREPMAYEPGDSGGEPLPSAECWVTLEWCEHPVTGAPYCTYRNCTPQQAVNACFSLIDDTCG